ncbi:MAG: YggS family pyridoxal phosphate-dependent enzyme [Vicingaceae bacterium]
MDIVENLKKIKGELGKEVDLVAVSKTKPKEDLQAAYDAGQRIFGENRPQEMQSKAEALPKDIEWHMVGHLQSNKVKYIAPFVSMIHSIDKLSTLKEINKRARQNDRVIEVLLQMHIAEEESKFGMNEEKLKAFLESEKLKNFENIRIVGMMGMATFTDDQEKVKKEFDTLKQIFDLTKATYFADDVNFKVLSMGMSGDYKTAIEAGSNMVRIGSQIFGARN